MLMHIASMSILKVQCHGNNDMCMMCMYMNRNCVVMYYMYNSCGWVLEVKATFCSRDFGPPNFTTFPLNILKWNINVPVSEGSSPRALSNGAHDR